MYSSTSAESIGPRSIPNFYLASFPEINHMKPARLPSDKIQDANVIQIRRHRDKSLIDKELRSYCLLEIGWDGYDGQPASKAAVRDAIDFLNYLPNMVPLPIPDISGDGVVGLYWRYESAFVDLSFHGDGLVTYYARGLDGKEALGDGAEFDRDRLPTDLIAIIGNLPGNHG